MAHAPTDFDPQKAQVFGFKPVHKHQMLVLGK